jgi:hypothetical protein
MDVQNRALEEFRELRQECLRVLRDCGWSPGRNLQRNPSSEDYARIRTRAMNLVRRTCGENSDHYRQLVEHAQDKANTHATWHLPIYLGLLEAAERDFERGLLFDLKALVEAEVLGDFLDQAEQLAAKRYHHAAASLGGAVLEDALRKLCDHRQVEYPPKTSIEVLNVALAKAEVYDKLYQKRITAIADLRNSADHGQFDKVKADEVQDMLKWIGRFTADFLK